MKAECAIIKFSSTSCLYCWHFLYQNPPLGSSPHHPQTTVNVLMINYNHCYNDYWVFWSSSLCLMMRAVMIILSESFTDIVWMSKLSDCPKFWFWFCKCCSSSFDWKWNKKMFLISVLVWMKVQTSLFFCDLSLAFKNKSFEKTWTSCCVVKDLKLGVKLKTRVISLWK